MFKTKPQIALDQIRAARAEGVPEGVVLADAGYGINTAFRTALTRMGLTYVVGVQSSARLWPPGAGPLPPKAWSGQGRPPTLMRRDAQNKPQSAEQLAKSLSADAWRDVAWREGVDKTLHSRFAVLRVRPAHRDYWRSHPYAEEWLLVEWPQGESAPTKYWLSTLPADTALATLVATAKLRWRIERDYQELKQELGLDHYEGRGWRGFHHHMALCVAAYGFLVSERSLIPPSDDKTLVIKTPRLSHGLSTPRIRRSEPNATSNRQSQASALSWPATSPDACPVAPVANEPTYDTVRLSSCWPRSSATNRPAVCRWTVAVIRIEPGSAAPWIRAAILGASPNTSPVASTTTCPESRPILA